MTKRGKDGKPEKKPICRPTIKPGRDYHMVAKRGKRLRYSQQRSNVELNVGDTIIGPDQTYNPWKIIKIFPPEQEKILNGLIEMVGWSIGELFTIDLPKR